MGRTEEEPYFSVLVCKTTKDQMFFFGSLSWLYRSTQKCLAASVVLVWTLSVLLLQAQHFADTCTGGKKKNMVKDCVSTLYCSVLGLVLFKTRKLKSELCANSV